MLRDASAKDDCRKELLMDIPTTDFVRAGSLEELKAKSLSENIRRDYKVFGA